MGQDLSWEFDRLSGLFSALGNETRLAILYELGSNRNDDGFLMEMSFEELRDAVGVSSSDGFNYHLKKLRGSLVTHGIDDRDYDEYTLTYLGYVVYRSIQGGLFRESAELAPYELDSTCHYCGHSLVVEPTLAGQPYVSVECSDCSHSYFSHPAYGARIDDGSIEDVLWRLQQQQQLQVESCRCGVCPFCAGPISREIVMDREQLQKSGSKQGAKVVSTCGQCREQISASVGQILRYHPAVVRFCEERDPDVLGRPGWELEWSSTNRYVRPVRADPLRLQVTIPCGGDELAVTIDETASVVDTEVNPDAASFRAE